MNINTIPNDLKKHQFNSQSRTILGPARLKETVNSPATDGPLLLDSERSRKTLSEAHGRLS